MFETLAAWGLGLVIAAAALVGPSGATSMAGTVVGITGATAGAFVATVPELMSSFNAAKSAAGRVNPLSKPKATPPPAAPKAAPKPPPAKAPAAKPHAPTPTPAPLRA